MPRTPQATRWLVLAVIALLSYTWSCGGDTGYPPVARITAAPHAIPANDGFMTAVTLDGTTSADPIDDPMDQRPLRFSWKIEGDEYRVDSGSLDAATVTIKLLGATPTTVYLTVTDEDGNASTAREQLQLTIP
jgi:hypothetical protein